jgi:hypothetical protein
MACVVLYEKTKTLEVRMRPTFQWYGKRDLWIFGLIVFALGLLSSSAKFGAESLALEKALEIDVRSLRSGETRDGEKRQFFFVYEYAIVWFWKSDGNEKDEGQFFATIIAVAFIGDYPVAGSMENSSKVRSSWTKASKDWRDSL